MYLLMMNKSLVVLNLEPHMLEISCGSVKTYSSVYQANQQVVM